MHEIAAYVVAWVAIDDSCLCAAEVADPLGQMLDVNPRQRQRLEIICVDLRSGGSGQRLEQTSDAALVAQFLRRLGLAVDTDDEYSPRAQRRLGKYVGVRLQ